MNPSELISNIKDDLGISFISLPFENPDEAIMQRIIKKTIPSFSKLFPYKKEVIVDTKDLELVYKTANEACFKIGDKLVEGHDLLYVLEVLPTNTMYNGSYFGGTSLTASTPGLYEDIMLGQAGYDLLSTVTPPFTYKFEAPNKLTIYHMSSFSNQLKLSLGCMHTENLSSISAGKFEAFYDLALLDVQSYLYSILKFYDKIETAYGTIDLRIDDWANAASERKDLLSRYKEDHHMTLPSFIIL